MKVSLRSRDIDAFAAALDAARNHVGRFPVLAEAARLLGERLPERLGFVRGAKCSCKSVVRLSLREALLRAVPTVAEAVPSVGSESAFVVLDPEMVATVVWAACGGSGAMVDAKKTGPLGAIESGLVRLVAEATIAAVSDALAADLPGVSFAVVGIKTLEAKSVPPDPKAEVFDLEMALLLAERPASLRILLPTALFAGLRDVVPRSKKGSSSPLADPTPALIMDNAAGASIAIEAVLARFAMTLSGVADLTVGSRIPLDVAVDEQASLECAGVSLAAGRIGKRDGRLAIEVESIGTGNSLK